MSYRPRKYLIVGPWVNNNKKVRDVLQENTDLKVSPRKLRVIQLANSDKELAIGDPKMVFSNADVTEENATRDFGYLSKYNVGLIYAGSSTSRENHMIIEAQVKSNEAHIALKLTENMFTNNYYPDVLRIFFEDRWKKDV